MRSEIIDQPRRTYRKRARAEQERLTRERITRATVALHESVGPASTTVMAIAARAGVQRATVYRHFPDTQSLYDACTSHYFNEHPMPDPSAWGSGHGSRRLRRALADLYRWYGETEEMLANSLRDMEHVPEGTRSAFLGYFEGVVGSLMAGRPERGRARVRVRAAVAHAVNFATWRSLVREQGLRDGEAVEVMLATVRAAARLRTGAPSA